MGSLHILEIFSQCQSHTVGVFPADQIPRVWTKPTAFVVNTYDHTSVIVTPVIPDHINRLRKNYKSFRWNTVQFQSDTDVCGQYCIMFLSYMCRGLGFEKFLDNFSKNLVKNDDIIRGFNQYKNADANFFDKESCFVRYLQRCRLNVVIPFYIVSSYSL